MGCNCGNKRRTTWTQRQLARQTGRPVADEQVKEDEPTESDESSK